MSFKSRRLINLVLTVLVILSLLTPSYSNYSSAAETGKILIPVAAESHDNGVKDLVQTPASQENFSSNTIANDASFKTDCVDEAYKSFLSIGNKIKGRTVTESVDSIDIDETYHIPASPGKSDGGGVYVRHISHMPKEIKPFDTQQDETEPKSKIETETETFSGLNSQTVIEEVYNVDKTFDEEDQVASVDKFNDYNYNYLYNESVVDKTYKEKDKVKNDFPIKNKSGHYKAGFSSKSGLNMLEFSYNDVTLFINPKDSNSVSGKVYANTISFNEIYKETDFHYTVEDNRLKEDITVNKYTGQSEFYFEMSVVNAVYEINSSGEISFYEPGTTNKLFWIAKPFAVDAKGDRCDSVSYSISKDGLIVLSIEPEWLRKAAYPIVIDPTIYLGKTVFYQASLGFSNIQGQNNWYYEEERSTGNYYQMTWDSTNNRWKGTYTWTLVGPSWQHPSTYNSVRTWRAPYSGTVSITGNVHKNNINSVGDGVNVKIMKNSTQIWPSSGWQFIAYNDSTGVNINFNTIVNAGDNIRFIMNKVSTDSADETHWDPIISYVLDASTFSRPSVAYKKDGTLVANEQPRYESSTFGQAIMMEEGTANLLTPNQASVETGTTGFSYWQATLARTTSQFWHGNASLGFTLTGTSGTCSASLPLSSPIVGTPYSASARIKGTAGKTVKLMIRYSGGAHANADLYTGPFVCDGTWQELSISKNVDYADRTSVQIHCIGYGSIGNVFYADGLQIEQKAYATSWQLPGTTRAAETLTIPTAGVMNKGNWAFEVIYTPVAPILGHPTDHHLWRIQLDESNENNYLLYVDDVTGRLTARVKSSAGGTVYITDTGPLVQGNTYYITLSGNGTYLRLFKNGSQVGSDTLYTEPVGDLPANMLIGHYVDGAQQPNGLIDDLRISNRARTLAEHQAAYNSNQPLPVDATTTCKMNFDGNLQVAAYNTTSTSDILGTGFLPYWNYNTASLGGGWGTSVNTFNLNLLLNKSLFSIPGRGLSIGESITYNSIDGRNDVLGIGWHLGSDNSLIECNDGSVVFNGGDGSAYIFTQDESSGYIAPPGIYLTLQKTASDSFTITDKSRNVYTYVNGKPTQSTDRDNNTTTYTYDSNGRLYQLSDPSGRTITYTYNTSGQLTGVTDPANRTYQFGYQNNRLITVTDPNDSTFALTYDTNGHLSSFTAPFTNPLTQVTTFSCDSNGKLNVIQDARTNGQDIYQVTFTQSVVNNQRVTTITDPSGHAPNYYHDMSTGNLVQFTDAENHSWLYNWSNNNLTSSQDAKGVTSYEYDANGNVTKKTVTVDSNPSNNMVTTMTYDQYDQLLKVVDGEGRKTTYVYNNKGDLISTTNADRREADGNLYDQYGNVIEASSAVSGGYNLLKNGSMEIAGSGSYLLANWYRQSGGATACLDGEGFKSHGNYALKLSSSTTTTDEFYQNYSPLYVGDKLTLRADIKVENVEYSGSEGGAMIQLEYGGAYYETYYCWGTGEFPLVVTSVPIDDVGVHIGLYNASGTAWFDGVQLERAYKAGDGYHLSAFNSVENSSFEGGTTYWHYGPSSPTRTTEEAYGGAYSIKFNFTTNKTSHYFQDVPVYGGEPLTFSGMVKTSNVTGTGAYFQVDYYDASNQIIANASVQTECVTGTQDDFIRLTKLASAPINAKYARVRAIMDGKGVAYFDTIKLIPRNSMKYTYNTPDFNYIITSEDALNKTKNYTYNEDIGTIESFSDKNEHTTHYYYDDLNRLVRVLDPLNHNAYYQYDSISNMIATRDPRSLSSTDNNYRTLFNYNNLNQLATLIDPANESTVNTYERAGNLSTIALPNGYPTGYTISYTYDDANRLESKTVGSNWIFNYTYDGANNLTGVTQGSNNYTWDYDRANRVKYSIDNWGQKINYQWDKSNNLEYVEVNNDEIGEDYEYVAYDYGKHNKLYALMTSEFPYIYYNYDENGRIFRICYPGNNYKDISYQLNGLCDLIQDTGLPNRYIRYVYEDNGNISTIDSWAGTESFTYDDNDRLTRWQYVPTSGNTIKEEYTYDNAGNRLTKSKYELVNSQWQLISSASVAYNYNNANKITYTGFVFDDNGNMTRDGTYNYIYNLENQLTQVTRVSNNSVVATYTYNYDGSRKSKTVNGVTTRFHWDAFGRMVRESDSSGNTIVDYLYDPSGKLVGYKVVGQTYFYHENLRGDIVSVTDFNGENILAQYYYDPWGNPYITAGISQPFRYAGYYYDEETGLYYCKSRYYSPKLGRFLTKDGYGFINHINTQELNLYTYVCNNPVNMTDSTGYEIESDQDLPYEAWYDIHYIWTPLYEAAELLGDFKMMNFAHEQAEALREAARKQQQGLLEYYKNKTGYALNNGYQEFLNSYGLYDAMETTGMSFAIGYKDAVVRGVLVAEKPLAKFAVRAIPVVDVVFTLQDVGTFGKGFMRGWNSYD